LVLESIQLVLFDLAGTTVDDRIDGVPLVVSAMAETFAEAGYKIVSEDVVQHRGKIKTEMVRCLLAGKMQAGDKAFEEEADRIHKFFLKRILENAEKLNEIEGTTDTFRFLKSRGIRIGVGSGFPAQIVERVISRMGWMEQGFLDYAGGGDAVGAGRPDPGMIQHAMQLLGIPDPRRVLKVGDTAADVEEGANAGAWTAAVLTGSQPEEMLRAAGPDFILESIAVLPGLFG